jgi:hypothetical protein
VRELAATGAGDGAPNLDLDLDLNLNVDRNLNRNVNAYSGLLRSATYRVVMPMTSTGFVGRPSRSRATSPKAQVGGTC